MDKIIEKLILEALSYGWLGVLTLFLVWDKVAKPFIKKRNGTFVSWELLAETIEKMEIKLNGHLEKEQIEDIKMERLFTEHDHFKESLAKSEQNQQRIYDMISEIKNMIIAMKYGK